MKHIIKFTKMHGAGNDYIYVNTLLNTVPDPVRAAIQWSDRHTGVGSDGLVLIGSSPIPEADFTMRIFNADGSEAMMCGNASRCVAKYLYERALTTQTQIRLLTPSGIKTLQIHLSELSPASVTSVSVDMLQPRLSDPTQFSAGHDLPDGTFVSMGNPHYVIFTDDIDQVATLGSRLELHPAFPQRCNIELAQVIAPTNAPDNSCSTIRMRVWERGSGITMACGTGACATAVAAALTGRTGRRSRIVMDGGELLIHWDEDTGHVLMTGPAEFVFDGEIELPEESA